MSVLGASPNAAGINRIMESRLGRPRYDEVRVKSNNWLGNGIVATQS